MEVKNAAEASEIVKDFLSRMGWSNLISPVKAEKKNSHWFVEFTVGFKLMEFVINAGTGEILNYGPK